MAFEGLGEKLQAVFRKVTGRGRLTEADIQEAMREVRIALLEADVNFQVVRSFVKKVTERALGQDVLASLTPGQQVIKIVNDELTELMGSTHAALKFGSRVPAVVMLCGLQGAGKTSMAGKLSLYLKKRHGKHPLLVACDVYRPAAVQQLQVVGSQVGVPVFERGLENPVETAALGVKHAISHGCDVVILDTAGRLHIDDELMAELEEIRKRTGPEEILLVVDAMTGQDAVNVADAFNKRLELSGVIMTKFDSDTRGGAALSVKAVTGKPIKFCGIGEKPEDFEAFHPDRMASRILGMGDMLSLIEKAQTSFDTAQAEKMEKKLREQKFDLEDFLEQFEQIKKMGSISDIMAMIPGMNKAGMKAQEPDPKEMARTEAIIRSMTPEERRDPGVLNARRRIRIARGSGTSVQAVNVLIKQFEQTKQLMKQFGGMGGKKPGRGMKIPFKFN
jgi:signal recognition particle subunit SRP54